MLYKHCEIFQKRHGNLIRFSEVGIHISIHNGNFSITLQPYGHEIFPQIYGNVPRLCKGVGSNLADWIWFDLVSNLPEIGLFPLSWVLKGSTGATSES